MYTILRKVDIEVFMSYINIFQMIIYIMDLK